MTRSGTTYEHFADTYVDGVQAINQFSGFYIF